MITVLNLVWLGILIFAAITPRIASGPPEPPLQAFTHNPVALMWIFSALAGMGLLFWLRRGEYRVLKVVTVLLFGFTAAMVVTGFINGHEHYENFQRVMSEGRR